VSDPVMENVTRLSEEDMMKVRFAKGPLAPKGHIYFPQNIKPVNKEQLQKAIAKGIQRSSREMLYIPGALAGVSGINYTAKHIRKWREKLGARKAAAYLGQIVRMQEEIGTGGGGFRFLYAAFLEEAGNYLNNDKLFKVSDDFTKAGDLWRASAVQMGRIYKGRLDEQKYYEECADMLDQIASIEKEGFKKLYNMKLSHY
jgi:hypothetical protein